ncbi:uncharacterized protein LOC106655027 [Trichogramma pretiosum]|uniref:uncharacterized protein LOC106655027 n=1 Tax=Trichogramma pretiosum TaxID=7493 RepID=UPI000C71A44B|nr:uncharacterized protein LOC106655027 [Trichogramma pretiosum]
MLNDETFDVLMEIRQVDKQISYCKHQVEIETQQLADLERKINRVQEEKLKALSLKHCVEEQTLYLNKEFEHIHQVYDSSIEYFDKYVDIVDDLDPNDSDEEAKTIAELIKRRDTLLKNIQQTAKEKEEIASKLNDVELQIRMVQKRNEEYKVKLQKVLDQKLQEERDLQAKLNSD